MTHILRARNLVKTFHAASGRVRALDGVSLEVREGEILGLLGPNGAGKTTLLNTLSTLLYPDAGDIEVFGVPVQPRHHQWIRAHLNMSSGYPNFAWSLTVEENLRFYGRLYGLSGNRLKSKVDELITTFDLTAFRRRRFEELSSGLKQRLALAKSFLNDPKLIFLDEPTIGLDPDVAGKMRRMIKNIFKEKKVTVLFTSHYMPEAEYVCDRIAFIKQGRILHLATPEELKARYRKADLEEVFIELAGKTDNSPLPTRRPLENKVSPGPLSTNDGLTVQASQGIKDGLASDVISWLNRVYAFLIRNGIFARRNVFAFVELLFWPMVTLLSIGLMGGYLKLEQRQLSFILTGAIAGGVLQVAQLEVAYSLLYDVWSKSLKQTFLTPAGVCEHLFGSWGIGMVRGLLIYVMLAAMAVGFFHYQSPALGITALFLLGLYLFALLVGGFVSILVLTFGQKAEITAWMFAYLFMLVCGIYYPVETLPAFWQSVAYTIPLTHFLESYRTAFGFPSATAHPWLLGAAQMLLLLALELFALRWAFTRARKTGMLVRLSE